MFARWTILIFIIFLFTAIPVSNFAQADFYKGQEAYDRGDFETALREWLIDANQGDADAQYNLGVMYANGRGVLQDYAEAAYWYRLAADQGLSQAQYNLGLMYAKGEGVPENDAEAVEWFRLAAGQWYAAAQFNLGLMYAFGEGVPENYITAYMWYNLAAAQGDDHASQNKNSLREFMTPEQIAEAQRLSTEWLEEHR